MNIVIEADFGQITFSKIYLLDRADPDSKEPLAITWRQATAQGDGLYNIQAFIKKGTYEAVDISGTALDDNTGMTEQQMRASLDSFERSFDAERYVVVETKRPHNWTP